MSKDTLPQEPLLLAPAPSATSPGHGEVCRGHSTLTLSCGHSGAKLCALDTFLKCARSPSLRKICVPAAGFSSHRRPCSRPVLLPYSKGSAYACGINECCFHFPCDLHRTIISRDKTQRTLNSRYPGCQVARALSVRALKSRRQGPSIKLPGFIVPKCILELGRAW